MKRKSTVIAAIIILVPFFAQSNTGSRHAHIYRWMNHADEEAVNTTAERVMNDIKLALQLSKEIMRCCGEGFAKLKAAGKKQFYGRLSLVSEGII